VGGGDWGGCQSCLHRRRVGGGLVWGRV